MNVIISVRCGDAVKNAAKKAAKEESRTLSNYIVSLIKEDCKKKRIRMEE